MSRFLMELKEEEETVWILSLASSETQDQLKEDKRKANSK
jgi:hypothetical protein